MAFTVQEFRSKLTGDGARPNLFNISLTFPNLAGIDVGGAATNKLTFMARAAQLPGTSVGAVPLSYFGREIKVAGNRTFPEWTITVINDEDFIIRRTFERWLSGVNSHAGNLRNPYMLNSTGYQTNGIVTQYGKTGDSLKVYNFIGVFPIDVSPIELDWASNDTIEEFSVTFAYQWWESDTTDGDSSLPVGSPAV